MSELTKKRRQFSYLTNVLSGQKAVPEITLNQKLSLYHHTLWQKLSKYPIGPKLIFQSSKYLNFTVLPILCKSALTMAVC